MIIDTKKAVSVFVGLVTGIAMSGATAVMPLVARADTTSDLQAQISAMLAQIAVLQAQLSAAGGTTVGTGYQFTMFLKQGVSNAEVKELQKVLNMDPATQVSATGAGAPGLETNYFGSRTVAAVKAFQTKYGLGSDGLVGKNTRAKLNSMGGSGTGTGPIITGTDLMVTLASDTPAAGSLIAGQAIADLAHFTFVNRSSVDAKITNMAFSRTGISNDSTLVNVYLYEGARRITDSAAVSQTKVTFNDTGAGIIVIPAGMSKTIAVKADIKAGTAGQVIGVSLDTVTSNITVSSALPIGGHIHSIASADMATVSFATTVSPTGTPAVDPQDGYVMWQNSVSIGTRAVDMKSFALRQIGSVGVSDLTNFKLYVDGTQVGSTVASLDANGYVTFDLTSSPKRLGTGTRIIKVVGDIVGGSNRTFSFSLRQGGDAMMIDSELGQPILATTFTAKTTGTNTVNQGNLTITKKADSLSGNIVADSSGVSLGKFEFKASGESIKVENLTAKVVVSTAGVGSLRNGALFANGVQVGSTAALANTAGGTLYNLGSSLIVNPGAPVVVEIRADIYDGDGAPATFANGDTITASLVAGTNNLQRTDSLTYGSNSAVAANQVSVATGALSMSKNAAYGNQATVDGKSAFKLASFNLVGGSAESINLDSIVVNFSGSSSTPSVATALTDVYVTYGAKTSTTKSSVVAGDNTYSINEVLAANGSLAIDVYGTLATTFEPLDFIIASSTVSGTTAVSSTAVTTGSSVGQTITVLAGSVSAAFVNDTSYGTKLLVGGTQQKVGSFKFTALNDSFTVTDIATKIGSTNAAGAIQSVVLKAYGSGTVLATTNLNGLVASSTGLAVNVPANSETQVDVYLNLNTIGAGAGTTTADVKVTLEGFRYQASAGSQGEDGTDADANSMYVVKTVPTITPVTLPSTVLSNTNMTIAKVAISSDSAGAIAWKQISFAVNKSSNLDFFATTLLDSGNNIVAGSFATTSTAITFTATNEQPAGTYSLNAVLGGISAAGYYSMSTNVAATASAIATPDVYSVAAGSGSFVWSDKSSLSHSATTPDWINDFKVLGLPTSSQTMSVTI